MSDTPQYLAARLRTEGEKTAQFFRSLPDETWDLCVYSEGAQWTVRQILAHLLGSEAGMQELIRNLLAGGAGVPEDFDINAYNERRVGKLEALSVEELLAEYLRRRQENALLVEAMPLEDLQRVGRHPWLGMTTIEEIIKILYRHNQIHQREIRQALAAG